MKSIGSPCRTQGIQAFGLVPGLNRACSWVPIPVHPLSLHLNMIPPPTDSSGLTTTVERKAHFPISSCGFQQPTYTTLDFHLMLTHCLTCLEAQYWSSLFPKAGEASTPSTHGRWGGMEGDPTRIHQLCPGLSILDMQLLPLSHPWAVHTTVQADANLYNCKPIRFSHPLLVA